MPDDMFRRRARRFVLRCALIAGVACAFGAPTAAAQTPPGAPPFAEDARSIAAAFRTLADVAEAAVDDNGWQRADAAYNDVVLAALDAHRAALAQAGDAARGPLAVVDGALAAVGQALDAQDAARIRAEAERVASAMDALAPGVAGGAPTVAAAVAGWRSMLREYERLADRQRAGEDTWRDMRNAAIALIDDVDARAAAVGAALPGRAGSIEQVRVLGYRLRMAALDQSADQAAAAARMIGRAFDGLDAAASSPGVPEGPSDARLWFEGVPVVAQVGQTVAVPIVTHGVAEVGGLGGFVLDVRWSPRALRLESVDWTLGDAARSATANDAAAGHYVLELPPAPVGPEVDQRVAELNMTVLGVAPDPGDYVPSDTLASMRAALDDAGGHVRTGELALASAGLFDAYAAFDDGRGTSGSLFARLDAVGQAASVDAAWLELLDRSSRPDPAGADAVVEAIDAARRALEAGVDAYVRSLAGDGELPITIDVVSATDLAGRPLPSRPSVAARVLTTGLVTATPPSAPAAADAGPPPVGSSPAAGADAPPDGGAPAYGSSPPTGAADGPSSPGGTTASAPSDGRPDLSVVWALGAALALGVAAAAYASLRARRGSPE